MKPAAIIVGLDCITGLQSARILAARDVPVIGVATDPDHFCARTRSVRAVWQADTSGNELTAALCTMGPTLEHKAVLYPCTDASVLQVARDRQLLEPWFHVVLPDIDMLLSLLDKVRFLEVADRYGLPLPPTRILKGRGDVERAARELPFPCILKPAVKTAEWERHSPAKVHRAEDGDHLLHLYERYGRHAPTLIAQRWVEGGDDTLYSCNCYYDRAAQPVCTFVARKLRQWPPRTGTSCLGEEVRNDTVRDLTLQLFSSVGFRGLGYLEVKRDPRTGEHVVIEANPGRPTGRSAIAEAGGVELLYSMYCETLRLPLPPRENLEQHYRGAKWIYWRQDIRSAFYYWRRGELSAREWIASWRGRKASAVFSWSDPGPALAGLPVLLRKAIGPKRDRPPGPRVATVEQRVVDYDVHGVVGVRVIDAAPADRAAIERQLGDLRRPLRREPDITVRFVDRIPTTGLRFVEVGRSGFTDAGLLVRGVGKRGAWVRIPFETLGRPSEFVCERGVGAVPLLKSALRLAALAKGYVPFHASAFEWKGNGVLVCGWTHGGKTSALLAFAEHGARFVGDDLVLLGPGGQTMCGLPSTLSLGHAHVRDNPRLRRRLSAFQRLALAATRRLEGLGGGNLVQAVVRKAVAWTKVPVQPAVVFPSGCPLVAEPKTLFLMISHAGPITVEPADPKEIARRMTHSQRFEAMTLLGRYHAFRFAFPEKRNAAIETMHEVEQALLERAVANLPAYVVRHPYPVPPSDLYAVMRPYCRTPPPGNVAREALALR